MDATTVLPDVLFHKIGLALLSASTCVISRGRFDATARARHLAYVEDR